MKIRVRLQKALEWDADKPPTIWWWLMMIVAAAVIGAAAYLFR